jgi:hypothetical protein
MMRSLLPQSAPGVGPTGSMFGVLVGKGQSNWVEANAGDPNTAFRPNDS